MTTLVLPFQRGNGATVFADLRADKSVTLAFTDIDGVVQPVAPISATWHDFQFFDGPTPQLLYSQDLAFSDLGEAATLRKVWLLDADGTVLTMASLQANVIVGGGNASTIAKDTILLTLAGNLSA